MKCRGFFKQVPCMRRADSSPVSGTKVKITGEEMTDEKFITILDKKLKELDGLVDESVDSPVYQQWHSTAKDLVSHGFGEKSRQYRDFVSIHHVPLIAFETSPQEDAAAFREGLSQDRALLLAMRENVENYGLPGAQSNNNSKSKTAKTQLNQYFYLTQSQVQTVKNDIDVEALEPAVREKLDELFTELEKRDKRDNGKVAGAVKWLADHAIEVLIAIIAAHGHQK
jgi:hypothetical protein